MGKQQNRLPHKMQQGEKLGQGHRGACKASD